MQLRAAGACRIDGGRTRAALCAQDPDAIFGMPSMWPHLLGRHALAAHARGARRALRNVLRRLIAGELTEDEALAELRSTQLEELGGSAQLDLGRYMRRGVPEVLLAPGKAPAEAASLAVTLALSQGQGLISRMTAEHRAALSVAAGAEGMSLVDYSSSARFLREGFAPEPVG